MKVLFSHITRYGVGGVSVGEGGGGRNQVKQVLVFYAIDR